MSAGSSTATLESPQGDVDRAQMWDGAAGVAAGAAAQAEAELAAAAERRPPPPRLGVKMAARHKSLAGGLTEDLRSEPSEFLQGASDAAIGSSGGAAAPAPAASGSGKPISLSDMPTLRLETCTAPLLSGQEAAAAAAPPTAKASAPAHQFGAGLVGRTVTFETDAPEEALQVAPASGGLQAVAPTLLTGEGDAEDAEEEDDGRVVDASAVLTASFGHMYATDTLAYDAEEEARTMWGLPGAPPPAAAAPPPPAHTGSNAQEGSGAASRAASTREPDASHTAQQSSEGCAPTLVDEEGPALADADGSADVVEEDGAAAVPAPMEEAEPEAAAALPEQEAEEEEEEEKAEAPPGGVGAAAPPLRTASGASAAATAPARPAAAPAPAPQAQSSAAAAGAARRGPPQPAAVDRGIRRRLVGKQPVPGRSAAAAPGASGQALRPPPRSQTGEVRARIGHTLSPPEMGAEVWVCGDGWGAGTGGYNATITEADARTFTVIRRTGAVWEETHVLREHCIVEEVGQRASKRPRA